MSTTNITSNTQLLSLQHGQVSAELLEILTALAACDSGVILTSIHEGQGHAVALKKSPVQPTMLTLQINGVCIFWIPKRTPPRH